MKKVRKTRRLIPIYIAIFAVIIISSVSFLIYTFSGNYFNYVNIDNSAETVTDTLAKGSDIIIVNGIVVGAVKDGKWVSAKSYYDANGSEGNIEINLYSDDKLYGTFLTAMLKTTKEGTIYTTIAKEMLPEEYLAVSSKIPKVYDYKKQTETTELDIKDVKKALSGYSFLNNSVNVTSVYTAKIDNTDVKFICATAKKANLLGVYSAVIFVSKGNAELVKYSHVRDTKASDRWPVYDIKYIQDLNGDGTSEIILQEVTGSDVKYTVMELRDNSNFYQVLSESIEI